MRRKFFRILFVSLIGLCFAGLPRLASPAPAAHAQGVPPVSVTVYNNQVGWSGLPSTQITGEIRSATGTLRARGVSVVNASGLVTLNLAAGGGGGGGGGGMGGNQNGGVLRPGDFLVMMQAGGEAFTLTIPTLIADVDSVNDRVAGLAPAGSEVEITVWDDAAPTTPIVEKKTADGSGAFSLDLMGRLDVGDGDMGQVLYVSPEGHRFKALFESFQGNITVGSGTFSGRASLGSSIRAQILRADGGVSQSQQAAVIRVPTWNTNVMRNNVQPGMWVTFTRTTTAFAAPIVASALIPNITVRIERATNTVAGSGPSSATITIEATTLGGQTVRRTVTSAADGSFRADFTGTEVNLGPGARVLAIYDVGNGLHVRASAVVPGMRIAVYGNAVDGALNATGSVTLTLKASDGTVKDTTTVNFAGDGSFNAAFTTGAGQDTVQILPGDVVELERTEGDPLTARVPNITTMTDAAGDIVHGETAPGLAVRVTVNGGGGGGPGGGGAAPAATKNLVADGNGQYSASFVGTYDLRRSSAGSVTVINSAGYEFHTGWVGLQLQLTIGNGVLTGNAPVGRPYVATLTTPAGKVAGTASGQIDPGGFGGPGGGGGGDTGNWNLVLMDNTGTMVAMQTGDTLKVTVGDDSVTLVLPKLTAVSHVPTDLVTGETTPNVTVTLRINHSQLGGMAQDVQVVDEASDGQGIFSHDFAGTYDIQYNDQVIMLVHPDDHQVTRIGISPGLTLDFNDASVLGAIEPNRDVTVELRDSKGLRSSVAVKTGADATFVARFRNTAGDPIVPKTGDEITVKAPASTEYRETKMVVPELTIEPDRQTNRVPGRATPGGTLQVTAAPLFQAVGGGPGGAGNGNSRPAISAQGTYTATFGGGGGMGGGGGFQLRPGTQLTAIYRLATGHVARYARMIPIINVQHGGGAVCGGGTTGDAVEISLADVNLKPAGSAGGKVSSTTRFNLNMIDSAKKPVFTAAGQKVTAKIGSETIEMILPAVTVNVNWNTGQISGTAAAGTAWTLMSPAQGCLAMAQAAGFGGPGGVNMFRAGTANQAGRFQTNIPVPEAGTGIQIMFTTADGNRFYRQIFKSLGQVFVRTSRVMGKANPQSPVTVILQSSTGTERARATTTAADTGVFEVMFKDNAGKAITIMPTDVVVLDASGENPEIPVEDLNFDFSTATGVQGRAPASRALELRLTLVDGRTLTIDRTADAQGRFSYVSADIPPRANWTFNDIAVLRAVLPTENGHEIVVESIIKVVPVPNPTGRKIYIPVIKKAVR